MGMKDCGYHTFWRVRGVVVRVSAFSICLLEFLLLLCAINI